MNYNFSPFQLTWQRTATLCIFLICTFGQRLHAQTTWDGSASTDWFNTDNWSAGVPDAADDVTIPGGMPNNPTIGAAGALATSVHVQSSATLTINAMGSLSINGNKSVSVGSLTATMGLYNEGTVVNGGQLVLGNTSAVGQFALWNASSFTNTAGGSITIDRSSEAGLGNQTGSFVNSGSVSIGTSATVGAIALQNISSFTNTAGGSITIDRSSFTGLFTDFNSSFVNSGSVIAGTSLTGTAIDNRGSFDNQGCAALLKSLGNGTIFSYPPGSFTNAGLIVENASGNSSITSNTGIVQNLNGGTFTVGSGNAPIIDPTTLVNACCTPPTAAIAITENNVTFDQFTGIAYYNVSYTDGNLCTGPAVPNPSTSATLTASGGGTYLWSNNATTAAITTSTAGTYTVTVTSAPGCTSTASRTISVNSAPSPGTITATPNINGNRVCFGSTIDLNSTVSGGVWQALNKPFGAVVSVTNLDGIVTPLLTTAWVDTHYVSYTVLGIGANLGCQNFASVTIEVVDPRNPGTISGNTNLCSGNTSQLTTNGQSGGVWASSNTAVATVNASTGLVAPLSNGTTTISYTLYGFSTNPSTACPYSATALVTIAPCCAGPVALCKPANAVLVGNSVTILPASVDNVSTAACGLQSIMVSPNTFNCSQVGTPQTVTLTVTDVNNATSTCTSMVTIIDNTPPSVTCKPATVNLSAAGTGSITTADVFSNGSDNCGTVDQVSVAPSNFACSNLGVNTVSLIVHDGNDNTSVCTATVTVADVTPPSVTCKPATVNLSAAGTGSITTADIFNNGSDNCGTVDQVSVTPSNFACSNLGVNTVSLIVHDGNGNTSVCTATVSVADVTPPSVTCKPATVNLSAAGTGSITTADVFNNGSDNCGIVDQVSVAPSNFACSNLGVNTVSLIVHDGNGNTSVCTATVTVADVTPPSVTCKPATVNLSAAGTGSITTASVFNNGSDNCGTVDQVSVRPSTFTCSNLGTNIVTLTVNDGNNNTATCTATVTVADVTPPSVTCKPATVNLSAAGTGSITTADVFSNGSDNCGTVNQVSVTPNALTCANLGANTVTLTVNDGNGNTATCTAAVTVLDNIAPTVVCKPFSVNLVGGATVFVPASSVFQSGADNCGTVNNVSVTPNTFSCANVGANTVTLTVNDGNGNTATCLATVTIADGEAPIALCQNVSKFITNTGVVTVTAAEVNNGSNDACTSIASLSLSQTSFNCSNVGTNTVILTVTDAGNNTATCSATVTISIPVNTAGTCAPPAVVANPNVVGNTVTFSWLNGCYEKYRVQYRRTIPASATWTTKTVNAPTNSTSAVMTSSGTYRWGLVAACAGISQYSTLTAGNNYVIAGSNSLQANMSNFVDATLWPNPAKKMIHIGINSSKSGTCVVRMFDQLGRTTYSTSFFADGLTENQFSVEGMSDGLYFVQILMAGQDPITKSVIVQR